MDKYVTIAEFSELVGITKQAVYKRLKTDLEPFSCTISGKKMIDREAINQLFNQKSTVEQPEESVESADTLEVLRIQLQARQAENESQQETIQSLLSQLKQAQDHIISQSAKMAEIVEKQNKLQENYQILLAQQQEMLKQPVVQPIPESCSTVEQPVESEKPSKIGFLSRLFHQK